MWKKIVGLALGIFVLTLAAALLFVDSSLYGKFVAGRISSIAAQQQIYLEFENPKVLFTGIGAKTLHLRKTSIPFPLSLSALDLRTSLFSLISGSPSYTLETNAYGGSISSSGALTSKTNSFSGASSLEKIHLEKHPQIEALGIEKGILSARDLKYQTDSKGLLSMSGSIELQDFAKPRMTSLPPFLTGGKPTLPIPPILFTTLQANVAFERTTKNIDAKNISLIAPQGSLKGNVNLKDLGNGLFSHSSRVALDGTFSIRLTRKGATEMIPVISLVTGKSIPQTARNISLAVKGSLSNPKWLVTKAS
jgi:hypothetical protein